MRQRSIVHSLRTLRRVLAEQLLRGPALRQSYEIGFTDPDAEVAVHLRVAATIIDVTDRFSIACAEPLVICVARDAGLAASDNVLEGASLRFSDRALGERLGELALWPPSILDGGGRDLLLFRVRGASNWCLPPIRLAGHYLLHAYADAVRDKQPKTPISFLHKRAMAVAFVRPHPVALVSLETEQRRNIFPMNLTGALGSGRVGLALQVARYPSKLIQSARRVAISSVPMAQASAATRLSPNHRRESIDWAEVPFPTSRSRVWGLPVPQFAQRVREVNIESIQALGSHAFCVGSVISDEVLSSEPVLCTIHGFYQGWRLTHRGS